jgi:phosphinothricin acetyltransferase
MSDTVACRYARVSDIPALTAIYNYYILNTAAVFELEPVSAENRSAWFSTFSPESRYKLITAACGEEAVGYISTSRFREKAAYVRSVEVSVFIHPDHTGRGIGSELFSRLLQELSATDTHRIYACIAVPNEASYRLHSRFGFRETGVFSEAGFKFGRYHDIRWMEKSLP